MPIITLTTDFGIKDHSVGTVKGALLSRLPEAKIVDITHQISPFNMTETAYILKNSYKSFPNGTIHIVGVDSELSATNKHIALLIDKHYFVCSDNGSICMITREVRPTKVVEIDIHDGNQGSFPVLDVFVGVACSIYKGNDLTAIGNETTTYKEMTEIQPKVSQNQKIITGGVIYIDNYGNIISNITKKLFVEVGMGREYTITAARYKFKKIVHKYNEICGRDATHIRQFDGTKLALFNSAGYLEIAIYRSNLKTVGGASSLLGLEYRDTITVEFT